ncbi:MAG: 23S rRNA (uracil(1939)-C(5))-methyltransferase RlmD [Actinomycetota bacterium]|nr:23S rRNA (uracil(1939)-C(5))-methyltransferase RlmD [Actinomycetota bacterium]
MRLRIEGLAYGGEGVAHLETGQAAFVAGSCPGDLVDVEITSSHKRLVKAKVTAVIEASPQRVEAPCPYFGECGGCQWQHVSYGTQLSAKRSAVRDALTRIGKIPAEDLVAESIASPAQYGYRNKIELLAEETPSGTVLGFAKLGTVELVPIDACMLVDARAQRLPSSLRGALRYVSGSQQLGLSRVGIRVARSTKDLEVALWTSPGPFPRQLAARTLAQGTGATNIVRVLTKGPAEQRHVTKVEVFSGPGAWSERFLGQRMLVSAPSFFQVNTAVAEKLVKHVLGKMQVDGTDRVLDLFSGAGTFTLPLAEQAGEVVAVESSRHALNDLRRNLESAQLDAVVEPGDAAYVLPGLGRFDSAVVDPPRTGLGAPTVLALVSARPRRIAYVSCDPATLARDAKTLTESGYRLVEATPVDLFPQTFHVETVAIFDLSE